MNSLLHANTYLLRSRTQFSRLVDTIKDLCEGNLLLFALSRDAPDLEQSVKQLSSSCIGESIGCLSSPLPIPSERPFFSCSVAVFDRSSCIPFSSLETGHAPIQVGRSHSFEEVQANKTSDDEMEVMESPNWDEIWNRRGSARFIPEELKGARDICTLIYFSDKFPMGFASAVAECSSLKYQLGMSAASTTFTTGRPVTLLRNNKVQSTGVVGIGLPTIPSKEELLFEGVVRLTPPLVVQRSEGNLIHELGDSMPARILLGAIEKQGISDEYAKNVDYYIGIRDIDVAGDDNDTPKLIKIVAGSPSRGSIAVEEVPAPRTGSSIEFYYRQREARSQFTSETLQGSSRQPGVFVGAFVTSPDNDAQDFLGSTESVWLEKNAMRALHGSFITSSEYGFCLGNRQSGSTLAPWRCAVPGTFGGYRFL